MALTQSIQFLHGIPAISVSNPLGLAGPINWSNTILLYTLPLSRKPTGGNTSFNEKPYDYIGDVYLASCSYGCPHPRKTTSKHKASEGKRHWADLRREKNCHSLDDICDPCTNQAHHQSPPIGQWRGHKSVRSSETEEMAERRGIATYRLPSLHQPLSILFVL